MNQFVTISKDKPFETFGYFTAKELYSKSIDAPSEHELSLITINAVNVVRQYYGAPMIITSTFRTKAHELALSKVTLGEHNKKTAIDSTWPNKEDLKNFMPDYHKQIIERGPLFQQLRKVGINGFGIYDGFLHLDSRPVPNKGTHSDEIGQFDFWDSRTKKPELPETFIQTLNNFFFSAYSNEDGDTGFGDSGKWVVRAAFFVVLGVALRRFILFITSGK